MSILLFLLFCFLISLMFGHFELERYPRYTTVRRHERKGTRGVRQHQRRISDGTRIIWIPHKKTPKDNTYSRNKACEKQQPDIAKSDSDSIAQSTDNTDNTDNTDEFGLKNEHGKRFLMLSVDSKLRIFDRTVRHTDKRMVYLFNNASHEKLAYPLKELTKDRVQDATHRFSEKNFERLRASNGEVNSKFDEAPTFKAKKSPPKFKAYYPSPTPNRYQNGYGSGFLHKD
ncbi:hypothetical protein H4F18_09790 [Vibrio scophthalmi]|uniref:hypothetical protein n=1 Tax=Vibrio scophthalmi TaxID=45658 RepID=UPI002FF2B675